MTLAELYRTECDPASLNALYYPYIQIRDENWLKGALLAFQQVRRIVPNRFTVRDRSLTKRYAELIGPAGPLLDSVLVSGADVRESQRRLRGRIAENLETIVAKYGAAKSALEVGGGLEAFEMHVGKFIDGDLLELLRRNGLAWHSREDPEPNGVDWVTLHPTMGSAIMTALALAVARVKGLSVVTPSPAAHHSLLANREEDVFDRLMELPATSSSDDYRDVTVEDVAHVVMTVGFDLTMLTPDQICELLNEGKDLRAFRRAVAGFSSQIPPGLDGDERERRLRHAADAVLHEWGSYTRGLPAFARAALVDSTLDKVPAKIAEAALTAAAGTIAATTLGALPGLGISVAVSAGVKMFRTRDTPLRFLSRIDRVVNRSISTLYVPQWRGLFGQQVS